MDKDDEQALIAVTRQGDNRAFETLVRRYQKPIFNVVYRMLHDADEARDVTQTVFLKTFENLHRYDPTRRLFSWICRIAINESINAQAGRKPEIEYDDNFSPDQPNPQELLQRDELQQRIAAALMTIDPDHRGVVILRHIAGLSYQDIGQSLDLKEETVKSRLFSARRKLRDHLKREDYL